MFELARLKVRRFRGFVDEEEFVFDQPVVLLYGENHRGKSSTLNALEWCLFGDQCFGAKTGIRERVDWEIPNRYVPGDVTVTAEFNGPDGRYTIRRDHVAAGRRGAGTVTVVLPDETKLHGDEAQHQLYQLFRSSFQEFMTTVYQHQEAIRSILTQEPRQRNEAIDRLLGLSEYRELLGGIDKAQLEKTEKALEGKFENLRQRAEQSIRTYDNLIGEEKSKAIAAGIPEQDMNQQEALRRAKEIGDAVERLTQDLGLADFQLTIPQAYDEIAEFRECVKTEADQLWAKAPDVVKQENLAREQQDLASHKGNYESARAAVTKAQGERDELVREHGDETALITIADKQRGKTKELEQRIRQTNDRANLVGEAIQYLKPASLGGAVQRCPLCGAEAPDLLAHLESEWEERIKKEVEQLDDQRKTHKSELERVESLTKELKALETNLDATRAAADQSVQEIGAALGRDIGKEEDPGALVNARLKQIASELEAVRQAIEEKRPRIGALYDELAQLRTIDEIVRYERKRAAVERIWETTEFAELSALRDQTSELVEDVRVIRDSIAAVSREEAQERVAAAGAAVDGYFCRLANHPAIPGLLMGVTEDTRSGLNSYVFKSKDGTDPTPILSQGDLNCLALSLFLGLAEAMGETQPFAFMMLDDPTQSLGSEMKLQLVSVLEGVGDRRRLIISTADTEFKELLMANITKSKAMYNFLDWTEQGGPQITRPS